MRIGMSVYSDFVLFLMDLPNFDNLIGIGLIKKSIQNFIGMHMNKVQSLIHQYKVCYHIILLHIFSNLNSIMHYHHTHIYLHFLIEHDPFISNLLSIFLLNLYNPLNKYINQFMSPFIR